MKKLFLSALAVALVALPALHAQNVNEKSLLSKIEKSDADIADAKKNTKAATWLNRAKMLYEVAAEPTKSLFSDMDAAMFKLAVGEPTATDSVTVSGKSYQEMVYPWFTAYLQNGKIATWKQTKWVKKDAIALALEAYNKAFELDPGSADKVKTGLEQISNFCSQEGNMEMALGNFAGAADSYMQAYDAQSSPANGKAGNPELLYFAGYLRTMDGATNKNTDSYAMASDYLNRALDAGYADEDGDLYYYLFHSYYGRKDVDSTNLNKAKDALLAGIQKFPKNEKILSSLVDIYTSADKVGDPADLIAIFDQAIAENPDSFDLWFGRGRIFNALKNYDEAIASFKHLVELQPDSFDANYYLGVIYVFKGDAMSADINAKQYTSQSVYDADLKASNDIYAAAVPYLEKAYELNPNDYNTLNMLKSLTFRLQDQPGMMEKYEKYDALLKVADMKQEAASADTSAAQ